MFYIPQLLPLHPVPWFAFSDFPARHLCSTMRLVWAGLLLPVLHIIANADALLSVTATAGTQSCQMQSSNGSASCSASGTVFVPAGAFDSPVNASGALTFGHTQYTDAMSLGPPSIGTLDYTLAGNWSMGQGIGLNNQASVSLSAVLTLPAQSGNWTFYSSIFDATDDSGGEIGPIEIVTSDGSAWLAGGFPSSVTIPHPAGTPFAVSLELSDFVAQADSSNNLTLDLRMVDPIAAPEPGSATTALLGLTIVSMLAATRLLRQRKIS
jgi:hypothetical protein